MPDCFVDKLPHQDSRNDKQCQRYNFDIVFNVPWRIIVDTLLSHPGIYRPVNDRVSHLCRQIVDEMNVIRNKCNSFLNC